LGISTFLNFKKNLSIYPNKEIKITLLDDEKRKKILENVYSDFAHNFRINMDRFFIELFVELFGIRPPQVILYTFQKHFYHKEDEVNRYSEEHFTVSAYRAMCIYLGKISEV
jgi:hypothetical protein